MATQRAPVSPTKLVGALPVRARAESEAARPLPGLGIAERRIIRRGGDLAAVMSPWLATAAAAGTQPDLAIVLTAAASWLLAASIADTYRPHRGSRLSLGLISSFITLAIAAGLFAAAVVAFPSSLYPATYFGFPSDLLTIAVVLAGWQFVYTHVFQQAALRRRALIVGSNNTARATARTLRRALARDYSLVGFVSDGAVRESVHVLDGVRVLGSAERLVELCRTYDVQQIILAGEDKASSELVEVLATAREQGVEITTMFDLYRSVTGRFPMEDGPAFRLAALTAPRERAFIFYTAAKRTMDITISLIGLAGVGLLIPFIAAANRLQSPGPLFYSQVRVGKGGRTFRILKFRSMVVNAERPGEAQWCRQNDTRITAIGRLLRRTHVDELPQLWNVLKGDMSFVGPRPERPELINELRANIQCYSARHAVRPGLPGWAQINYPYGNTLRDALVKLEYDLYYIQHRGIWLDVLCMLRTARAVVMMTGI